MDFWIPAMGTGMAYSRNGIRIQNCFPFLGTGSKTQFPIFRKGNSTLLFSRTSEKNQLTSKYTFSYFFTEQTSSFLFSSPPLQVEVSSLPWKFTTSGTGSRYSWECMGTRITAHPWCLNCTLSSFFPPAFVCNFHQAAIQRGQP